jgi:adenine-specific DNA-methyltransferase
MGKESLLLNRFSFNRPTCPFFYCWTVGTVKMQFIKKLIMIFVKRWQILKVTQWIYHTKIMRYIGSKKLLLKEIENIINVNISTAHSFCDIFSGTSVVARYFKKNYKIISNDFMYFSYVLQKATIENETYPNFNKLKSTINKDPFLYFKETIVNLNLIKKTPFIYNNYSPNKLIKRQYFSNENALRIDFIRQSIEQWNNKGLLEENEYYYLLAGLIEAVPFYSNIAGTYGAYLKHWDKRANKKLELVKLNTLRNNKNNTCFNKNANEIITIIEGDILYIDPPYNSRQYGSNYHLLETISRYDNPDIYGKTGMRPYDDIKSKYCQKRHVLNEFKDLIANAKFKHIILSYSTEGIMNVEDIENILKGCGIANTYKLKKIPYRRYKHKEGDVKHDLHELLFYIQKEI